MSNRPTTRAVVPSLFTVLNIFCGFRSVLHAAEGDFTTAAWFIILAGVFDVLDGMMARITKSSSDFGVEFDSLSDVVSFGVAPAFLVYRLQFHLLDGVGILLASLPMVFGALRLARFNAQLVSYDKDYFKGLPIPASAIAISAFVLAFYRDGRSLSPIEASLLGPMVLVLAFLMVSTIKYDTFPSFTRKGIRQHPMRFAVALIAATAIVLTRGQALFPFFVFYVATGPFRTVVQFFQHVLHPEGSPRGAKANDVSSLDI
jgi:CDP-diacylglycerol--serine O-phosphatidyltransferase